MSVLIIIRHKKEKILNMGLLFKSKELYLMSLEDFKSNLTYEKRLPME